MADGRIGEQSFQVLLEDRRPGTQDQRDQPDAGDDQIPRLAPRQHGPQPDQQEHACLHHRRRMEVGRNRRGRRHRVGQPEVERELRALGERADQDEDQRRQVEAARADPVPGGEHRIEIIAPDDLSDQENPDEQAQPARCRDDQRHAGRAARAFVLVPIADEEERGEAGQFPEKSQLHEVPRKDQREHRAHEGEQEREEARDRIARRHVVARIDHHQQADREDEHRENPGEAVQAEDDVEPQRGQPGNTGLKASPIRDLRIEHRHQHRARERDRSRDQRCSVAASRRKPGNRETAHERQQQDEPQGDARRRDRHSPFSSPRAPTRSTTPGVFDWLGSAPPSWCLPSAGSSESRPAKLLGST